ncbi:popeye domain-containing protein 3 isoform X1 [Octopus bimaculoides]|uniref:popeye domain-containing protein 3 isoform X1 n=1 Tax=Octopus bimaculoides TaxID=37653 RepID=UPI00071D989E|nr:popeye domain-containing protein 3 isoform X1 [Octopus bimaculoides]XP_014767801.1 popeye domain-containing protein 3 isoform X1 [Octopus bimaculoides]|eukprot:XP_014767794.1 PREDICTED: popeye domain-containing protein 3-like isoform X1 [Octopus bimaculoides]
MGWSDLTLLPILAPLGNSSVSQSSNSSTNFTSAYIESTPTPPPLLTMTAPFSVTGCTSWKPINHILFQLANAALCIGLMAPDGTYGVLFLHSTFLLGFLLLSAWSWVILCAPDFFSWNFAFMIINGVQLLLITYRIRPVKFCDELEEVYISVFQPLRVPRSLFKKLTHADYCTLMTLYQGECYATQSITKTDKLGLLISGMLSVYSSRNFLHHICQGQFIDTPEFESSVSGEEKYQVSIVADTTCRYIFWSRHSLEYLMIKEPYLATVLCLIFGRDITNKLYALNEKVLTPQGSRMDIRLPSISSSIHSGRDIRKTIAGINQPVQESISGIPGTTNLQNENDDEDIDVFQENGEKVELLNGHVNNCRKNMNLGHCSMKSSRTSDVRFEL